MKLSVIVESLRHLSREQAYQHAIDRAAFHAERAAGPGFHSEMTSAWLRAVTFFGVSL